MNGTKDEVELRQTTTSSTVADHEQRPHSRLHSIYHWIYDIVSWTPPRCRWDPEKPPKFSMALNLLFGFACTFTVANLYYSHPILNVLADDFGVPYEKVSQIPTVMQAGYACGMLLLCPLGDLLRRRPFVLWLVLLTAALWIGLCITESLAVFTLLSFLTAVTTVTPQLMLPLVGDLAPPKRRAAALSIVVSGLLLGMLIARLLSGILTNYTSWRTIYWLSLGLQYFIFVLLWIYMPDYPSTNPSGLNYFKMLYSILDLLVHSPVLVQASLNSFLTASTFTTFWTVLTALLSSPPYNYTSLPIGLFALIGIAALCLGPLYARLVIDTHIPLFSVILGDLFCLLGITISTFTSTRTIAGPIIQAFLNDFGLQTAQIANRSAIYSIAPKARNRVNTAFMVSTFCGQLVGTSAGNAVYAKSGWVGSGGFSIGMVGGALLVCLVRGPWEECWVGWRGGWSIKKRSLDSGDGKADEKVLHGARDETVTHGDVEQAVVNQTGPDQALQMDAAEDGVSPLRELRDRDEDASTSVENGKEKDQGESTALAGTAAASQ